MNIGIDARGLEGKKSGIGTKKSRNKCEIEW